MTGLPSLSYRQVVNALQRAGERVFKLTVPAHNPIKKTTLARIIKEAELTVEEFRELI